MVFDNHRRAGLDPLRLPDRRLGEDLEEPGDPGLRGYALSIEQDPVDTNLLFLGTEFGLYVSFDGGGRWMPLDARPADDLGDGADDPSARISTW